MICIKQLRKMSLLIVILSISVFYCTTQIAGPGNSSDVGNPVVIASAHRSINGKGPAGCNYTLYNTDYNPASTVHTGDIVLNRSTDSLGKFNIDSLPSGHYNLIFDDTNGKALYVENVPVFTDSNWTSRYDSLSATGYIEGKAISTNGKLLTWTFVYIPGTPFYSYTGSSGNFIMKKIPAGKYSLMYYGIQGTSAVPDTFQGLNSSANIPAGDTITVNMRR